MKLNKFFLSLTAILTGCLLTAAFAPFSIFPLAILSPALLLSYWLSSSPKQAFWRGWLFGLGFFGTGVYWIYISVHTFGNTPMVFALFITALLVAFLALYTGANGYLLNRFFPENNFAKLVCAFPATWVLLEWLRGWFLSGFPWLLIGYSQINSPLRGYAPILSVYGVSIAVLMSSGLLVYASLQLKPKNSRKFLLSMVSLTAIWLLGACLNVISWTTPTKDPVKVSLVQGNIAQSLKWAPDQIQPTLDKYVDLTRTHWNSQIIIWPESAIPLPMHTAADFLENLAIDAGKHNTTVITGIPIKASNEQGYYNGVIALGKGDGVYTKQQLVPFGEYIPFRKWLGHFMDLLQVPMSDFISGEKNSAPLIANGIKIATFICYEIAYPQQVVVHDNSVDMLLTVSNDAWFGDSIAQAQHAQMAQMRALEMGRPLLFVANDGITAIINAHGQIQSIAPQHETYVLTGEVHTMEGKTPWQYLTMYPVFFLLFMLMLTAVRRQDHAKP